MERHRDEPATVEELKRTLAAKTMELETLKSSPAKP
jgi:hypothetical protein